MDRIWDAFVDGCQALFIPLVYIYFSVSGNLFLNSAAQDASGLELVGDTLLTPFQYLFCGQSATPGEDGIWVYTQKFDYREYFWVKTAASIVVLPPSFILGCAAKGISWLSNRDRFASMYDSYYFRKIHPNIEKYRELGIAIGNPDQAEWISSQGYARRPEDIKHLEKDKQALTEIAALLNEARIPWWLDCGSCLGAYRYGGVIPWDCDIDIAVLLPDFDNVRRALLKLDPKKYSVQDWSGRLNPQNYFKVYIRETGKYVDIYYFAIDANAKTIQYILSLETSSIFPEWWKIRERRFKVPAPFEIVFPLKKAYFDGIEVFIPNNPVKYLQRCYGENLAPAKVYNPVTNYYEKDLNHPYWNNAYVH